MAESKSAHSARNINAYFEKTVEHGLNSINRLTLPSKCSPLSCCLESSTRSKLAHQIPDTQIGFDYERSIPARTDNCAAPPWERHSARSNGALSAARNQALKATGKLGRVGGAERPRSDFSIAHDGVEQRGVPKRGKQRVGVGHFTHSVQIKMLVRFDVMLMHQV
jgi:hypothetical protein